MIIAMNYWWLWFTVRINYAKVLCAHDHDTIAIQKVSVQLPVLDWSLNRQSWLAVSQRMAFLAPMVHCHCQFFCKQLLLPITRLRRLLQTRAGNMVCTAQTTSSSPTAAVSTLPDERGIASWMQKGLSNSSMMMNSFTYAKVALSTLVLKFCMKYFSDN